jgi:hypothetical protein
MFIVTPVKEQECKSISTRQYRSDRDVLFLAREEIRDILRESLSQPL